MVETGTFTGPESIKSVRLSQAPYVEKSAQVFINGNEATNGVYLEEDNIYFASGATDRVFQIVTNDDFAATVVFGDNTLGQAPAVGDSYTITYRVGGGSRGNIPESFINAEITGTAKLADGTSVTGTSVSVENSTLGTGGADAESIAKVKRYAPLKFRSQNRCVTLQDYTAFANTFTSNYGSTGKARAVTTNAYSTANNIDIYVLEKASDLQLRAPTAEYKLQLLTELDTVKMITDEPLIVNGLIRPIDVEVTLTLDRKFKIEKSQIIARANAVLLNYFNVDNFDFGLEFNPQDLIREIIKEPQVRFATVDNITEPIFTEINEIIQLNNFTITAEFI